MKNSLQQSINLKCDLLKLSYQLGITRWKDDSPEIIMQRIAKEAKRKKLNTDLCAPEQFREAKKINYILFSYWDPININGLGLWDEYISLVPEILALKTAGAGREAIAEKLLDMQTTDMGIHGTTQKCRLIADMILRKV